MEEQYFALLIDADNVSAKYITPILTECFLEAGTADEFDHADPAVQLHDRKECDGFCDDHRRNGYFVHERRKRFLYRIE